MQSRRRNASNRGILTSSARLKNRLQNHVILARHWACQKWACTEYILKAANTLQVLQVRGIPTDWGGARHSHRFSPMMDIERHVVEVEGSAGRCEPKTGLNGSCWRRSALSSNVTILLAFPRTHNIKRRRLPHRQQLLTKPTTKTESPSPRPKTTKTTLGHDDNGIQWFSPTACLMLTPTWYPSCRHTWLAPMAAGIWLLLITSAPEPPYATAVAAGDKLLCEHTEQGWMLRLGYATTASPRVSSGGTRRRRTGD